MDRLLSTFYLLAALVWLVRGWKAFRALDDNPEVRPHPSLSLSPSPVSLLLPVKNEESNLRACLEKLLAQDYPSLEIIVINDHSVDRTSEILQEIVNGVPGRIRVVENLPLPKGWTGKNWAIHQGVPHAQGKWLLFTDADTRFETWAVRSAVAYAEQKELQLLTLSPRCLAEGFWEKALQPTAMGYLAHWFPFPKVNNPRSPLVFGNGQFFLIQREVYETLGGHEKVRGAFLEDFALVREAKKQECRLQCAVGTQIYGTRMYHSFRGIWRGWRRIFHHAFEKHPGFLWGKAISVFVFSVLPFLLLLSLGLFAAPSETPYLRVLAGLTVLGILYAAWKTYQVIGTSRRYAFVHPLAGLVLTGILADAAWHGLQKKETKWR
jgi:glycosyltransferase involved in cell wall biosynthesis